MDSIISSELASHKNSQRWDWGQEMKIVNKKDVRYFTNSRLLLIYFFYSMEKFDCQNEFETVSVRMIFFVFISWVYIFIPLQCVDKIKHSILYDRHFDTIDVSLILFTWL